MNKNINWGFVALHILVWLIFVGLSIEAGGLLVNFVFSICKPEMIVNLYNKLNLIKLYQFSATLFYVFYLSIFISNLFKVIIFYKLIQLLLKIELENPFTEYALKKLQQIIYFTLSIIVINIIIEKIYSIYSVQILDNKIHLYLNQINAFVLMLVVLLVFQFIMKKALVLKNENDLTI